MFQKGGLIRKMEMLNFDIPDIHLHNDFGAEFLQAIFETTDIKMFKEDAIQMIVNVHWKSPTI